MPDTILVIDDDPAIRAFMVDLLAEEGYCVIAVANGQSALIYLNETCDLPQLILLDLLMPGMNGWEFR